MDLKGINPEEPTKRFEDEATEKMAYPFPEVKKFGDDVLKCPQCGLIFQDFEVKTGKCHKCKRDLSQIEERQDSYLRMVEAKIRGKTAIRRYIFLKRIGGGGMGEVFKVYDTRLQRICALKIIKNFDPNSREGIEWFKRFERESMITARLDNPNIIKLFDYGIAEDTPFYCMEYVEGESLDRILGRNKTIPVRAAMKIIREIALALHYAHSHGVIHRDIKPNNIMLVPVDVSTELEEASKDKEETSLSFSSGLTTHAYRVLLTDFGLALDVEASRLTITGEIFGTPHYMSPEQWEADRRRINQTTDVYSLGVTAYHLITSRFPFEGKKSEEIRAKVTGPDLPTPIRTYLPHINKDLEAIIHKAITKEQRLRYQSALELAQDCERFLKGESVTARVPGFYYKLSRKIKKYKNIIVPSVAALLFSLSILIYFAFIKTIIEKQRFLRELAAKKEKFLQQKKSIEETVSNIFSEAKRLQNEKKFEKAIESAQNILGYKEFSQKENFPIKKFESVWDESFKTEIPFKIPYIQANILLSECYDELGRFKEALEYAAEAFNFAQEAPEPILNLAFLFLRNEDYAKANYFFKMYYEYFPNLAQKSDAVFYIGYTNEMRGDLRSAKRFYEQYLNESKANIDKNEKILDLQPAYMHPDKRAVAKSSIHLIDILYPQERIPEKPLRVALGDIDSDGKDEVIVINEKYEIMIYKSIDKELKLIWKSEQQIKGGGDCFVEVLDVDSDGKNEMIISFHSSREKFGWWAILRWNNGSFEELFEDKTLYSHVYRCVVSDLDGDDVNEIIFTIWKPEYSLRIYKLQDGKYVHCAIGLLGSDPNFLSVEDLDNDGEKEIIVGTGPWTKKDCFRVHIFHYNKTTSKLIKKTEKVAGYIRNGIIWDLDNDGRKEIIVLTTADINGQFPSIKEYYDSFSISDIGLMSFKYQNNSLEGPFWIKKFNINELNSLKKDISYALLPVTLGKEINLIIFLCENQIAIWHILSPFIFENKLVWFEKKGKYFGKENVFFDMKGIGDIDDDDEYEIVRCDSNSVGIYGFGVEKPYPTPLIDIEKKTDRLQARLIISEKFAQAGDKEKAIEHLKKIANEFPSEAKSVLFEIASLYENWQEWDNLYNTLEFIASNFTLSSQEEASVEKRRIETWNLLNQREQIIIDFTEDIDFLTDNPLRFRLHNGDLHIYQNADENNFLAIPVHFDAEAFEMQIKFTPIRLEWSTRLELNIANEISQTENNTSFGLTIGASGGGDILTFYADVFARHSQSLTNSKRLVLDDFKREILGKNVTTKLTYVKHLDKIFLTLSGDNIKPKESSCDVRFRTHPFEGWLILGTHSYEKAKDCWLYFVADKLSLKSSNPAVKIRKFSPRDESISENFLKAGSEFVKKNFEESAKLYKKVLNLIEDKEWKKEDEIVLNEKDLKYLKAKILFFLTYAYYNTNNKDLAKESLKRVFKEHSMNSAFLILERNFYCLTEDERFFFRDVFYEYKNPKTKKDYEICINYIREITNQSNILSLFIEGTPIEHESVRIYGYNLLNLINEEYYEGAVEFYKKLEGRGLAKIVLKKAEEVLELDFKSAKDESIKKYLKKLIERFEEFKKQCGE